MWLWGGVTPLALQCLSVSLWPFIDSIHNLLDIEDLDCILTYLKFFSEEKWLKLGLKLGLYKPTLSTIEANHPRDVGRCLIECLTKWLERSDKVNEKGVPTLSRLADALEEIGDKKIAEELRKKS